VLEVPEVLMVPKVLVLEVPEVLMVLKVRVPEVLMVLKVRVPEVLMVLMVRVPGGRGLGGSSGGAQPSHSRSPGAPRIWTCWSTAIASTPTASARR
jgi:hypothetical protein